MTTIRTGALGALMDEYERSTIDLKIILSTISENDYKLIRAPETKDPDCQSIQTIIVHAVHSGYTYANYLNTVFDDAWKEYNTAIDTASQGIEEINKMLGYTDHVLTDKYQLPSEQVDEWLFKTRWGVTYDTEQLLEHAIVHILRHRRQIENFLK